MFIKKLYFLYKFSRADTFGKAKLYAKTTDVKMGDGCQCFGKVDFGSEPYLITLGDKVKLTENVRFATHDGGMLVLDELGLLPEADNFGTIDIGNNVFIGMNSIIMKNVKIGDNVVIGAGTIVSKDCESNSVYAGIPAKKIKTLEAYYENVKDHVDYTLHYTPEDKKKYLLEKYK